MLETAVEQIRRTKVFQQKNLVFHTAGTLITFPATAVSRLDLITSEPIRDHFAATWRNARELCGADYHQQRDAIINNKTRWLACRATGTFPVINTLYLLGGYTTHLLLEITLSEGGSASGLTDHDVSMLAQHAPPPTYTIHRCDGGVSFLNSANVVRMERIPGYQVSPSNALIKHAVELNDLTECVTEGNGLISHCAST